VNVTVAVSTLVKVETLNSMMPIVSYDAEEGGCSFEVLQDVLLKKVFRDRDRDRDRDREFIVTPRKE
jgi:hypothetical protein